MRVYIVAFPESDEGCATFSSIDAAAECVREELEERIDDTLTQKEYEKAVEKLNKEIDSVHKYGWHCDFWIFDWHIMSDDLK